MLGKLVGGIAAGLVFGFFAGFYVANNLNREATLAGGESAPSQNREMTPMGQSQISAPALPGIGEALDAAKNRPDDFDAQVSAGEIYLRIENFEIAAEYFEKAAAIGPRTRPQTIKLANGFFDVKKYDKAATLYEKALAEDPKDVAARTDLGITFVQRAEPDYDRAIREFEASLKLDPKHEPTLYNITAALHRKGDTERARKHFDKLVEINPQSELVTRLRQLFQTT